MSSTILELMRLNHELAEMAELQIGEELDVKPMGVRDSFAHPCNALC